MMMLLQTEQLLLFVNMRKNTQILSNLFFETENQYSKHDGALKRIMDEHTHGKYVAYCEGDDYWIDPFKLQNRWIS